MIAAPAFYINPADALRLRAEGLDWTGQGRGSGWIESVVAAMLLLRAWCGVLFLFWATTAIAAAACRPAERDALLRFKKGVATDTTGTLATWAAQVDCCSGGWEGIECDAAGAVVTVSLENRDPTNSSLYFSGTLSSSLAALKSLQILQINNFKRLSGIIPPALSLLTQLRQLYLENNDLSGPVPTALGRLSRLQALSLAGNRLSGTVPPSLGNLSSLVQLNLGGNRLWGVPPAVLAGIKSLQFLDLRFNQFSGAFPSAVVCRLPELTYLDLSGNSFNGNVAGCIGNLSKLEDVYLDHNRLSGVLPPAPRSVGTLSLSHNMFSGEIPASLGQASTLWNLNLSRNYLWGALPQSLAGMTALASLDLSHNNLSLGSIPAWLGERAMTDIRLAGCGLTGSVTQWRPQQPETLQTLDLSYNNMSGDITAMVPKLASLEHLRISHNALRFNISGLTLPPTLATLDAAENNIYGSAATLFGAVSAGSVEFVSLAGNLLSGHIPEMSKQSNSLRWLDLSRNHLSGPIPVSLEGMRGLVRLDLSRNRLQGKIPGAFGAMKKLQWLDLAENALSGRIPEQLLGLPYLRHLSLRSNKLCGIIPQGKPFSLFPASAYAHNRCLCGTPLPACKKGQADAQS